MPGRARRLRVTEQVTRGCNAGLACSLHRNRHRGGSGCSREARRYTRACLARGRSSDAPDRAASVPAHGDSEARMRTVLTVLEADNAGCQTSSTLDVLAAAWEE